MCFMFQLNTIEIHFYIVVEINTNFIEENSRQYFFNLDFDGLKNVRLQRSRSTIILLFITAFSYQTFF